MIDLPIGWKVMSGDFAELPINFLKIYPNGTNVIVEIKFEQNNYEVWSRSAHRCAEPYDTMVSRTQDVYSANKIALSEMVDWDEYFSKLDELLM